MSLEVYKLLHFTGIFLTFAALGGQFLFVMRGGTREDRSARRIVAISHGIGLTLLLVGGFGMHAKLGYQGFPIWFAGKVGIWAVLGALMMVAWRMPNMARPLWFLLPVLGFVAAWLGIYKPLVG